MERSVIPFVGAMPHELTGFVIMTCLVLGGLCMIVGARKQASSLIMTGISFPFVTMIIEVFINELFSAMPAAFVNVIAWLFLIIFYGFLFGSFMGLIFGRTVWNHAKGDLLAGAIRGGFQILFSRAMLIPWGLLGLYLLIT